MNCYKEITDWLFCTRPPYSRDRLVHHEDPFLYSHGVHHDLAVGYVFCQVHPGRQVEVRVSATKDKLGKLSDVNS
jgi:hypothetical protein